MLVYLNMDYQKITFFERLKLALKAKKKSQSGLAKAIGVSPSAITQWKSDAPEKKYDAMNILKTAEELGTTPKWLLTGEGEMFPNERIEQIKKILAGQNEFVLDEAVKDVASLVELLSKAQKHNGTNGA